MPVTVAALGCRGDVLTVAGQHPDQVQPDDDPAPAALDPCHQVQVVPDQREQDRVGQRLGPGRGELAGQATVEGDQLGVLLERFVGERLEASALLAGGLARADADALPIALETGTSANIAFYERRGFETKVKRTLPGGPDVWLVARQPRPGPAGHGPMDISPSRTGPA